MRGRGWSGGPWIKDTKWLPATRLRPGRYDGIKYRYSTVAISCLVVNLQVMSDTIWCAVVEEVYKPEKVVPPEMSGPGDIDESAPGEFDPEDGDDDDEDYRNKINQMPGMSIC